MVEASVRSQTRFHDQGGSYHSVDVGIVQLVRRGDCWLGSGASGYACSCVKCSKGGVEHRASWVGVSSSK